MENKRKFKLFDMNRDGKGVAVAEDTTPNLKFFFKQFGRKFSKIISLNMLMLFQIVPILLILYLYIFAMPKTPTQYYPEYSALFGIQEASSTALSSVNLGLFSFQLGLPEYNSYVYWIIGALIVFLVVTYGWQKVGSIYVTRGLVRGDSVFIFSDYFYAIKKNFWQGLFLGLIDCAIMGVLGYNYLFFINSMTSSLEKFMYVMTVALIILYIVFRFYMYLMLVTFNIKITKLLKNALIFTVLGLKRNILALVGLILVSAVAIVPMMFLIPMGLGVAMVLPLIYYLGVCCFIYTYAAYPIIKRYMIDPVMPVSSVSSDDDQDTLSGENESNETN